ncbi:hypothetical protein [Bacteroides sedimenti]|uniref:hypothetical protein n=1 Tax=Bacteroides sedimenti TaxID=2136147 RepID=UPI003342A643
MKKNKLFILGILTGLLIILFFKGCSSFITYPSRKGITLNDSIKFSNPDSIQFTGIGSTNNIPIVRVNLGFYGIKYFLIDTGSSFSIIDSEWVHEHEGLIEFVRKIDYIRLQSFSERTSSDATYAIRLLVNGVQQEFVILDIKSLREKIIRAGYDIIGIIGSDFLAQNKYIIDYNKRCIYKPSTQQTEK